MILKSILLVMWGFVLVQGLWAYDVRQSVVKIYAEFNAYDYRNPWQKEGVGNLVGSGAIIDGNRILTNAHVVKNQTFIQVKCSEQVNKYVAWVEAVAHDVDLAILRVDDPEFFKGRQPLKIGDLPRIQDPVSAIGYPIGGTRISITEGIVSRIEIQRSAHSDLYFLSAQIDANLNPGSSGGPVISKGKIAGVAYQGSTEKNIFGMIPAPVVQHFLKDIRDGVYDGMPWLGLRTQRLENANMRRYYLMRKEHSGELVLEIMSQSSAYGLILPEDIILEADGHVVGNDGTVEFRDSERVGWSWLVNQKQIGDTIQIKVLRRGDVKNLTIPLANKLSDGYLVKRLQFDRQPSYFIFGGLVFYPLTLNFIDKFGDWRGNILSPYLRKYTNELINADRDELVVLSHILTDEINAGIDIRHVVIDSVNGFKIRNMKTLMQAFDESREPYFRIVTETRDRIVLKADQIRQFSERILKRNNISSDRSEDLLELPTEGKKVPGRSPVWNLRPTGSLRK
jgi:S1-C subfamily serine protease